MISYVSGNGTETCPDPVTRGRTPALGTTFHDRVRVTFRFPLQRRQRGVSRDRGSTHSNSAPGAQVCARPAPPDSFSRPCARAPHADPPEFTRLRARPTESAHEGNVGSKNGLGWGPEARASRPHAIVTETGTPGQTCRLGKLSMALRSLPGVPPCCGRRKLRLGEENRNREPQRPPGQRTTSSPPNRSPRPLSPAPARQPGQTLGGAGPGGQSPRGRDERGPRPSRCGPAATPPPAGSEVCPR